MNLATLATILVAVAFLGLCVWVFRPANKTRLEEHGRIPLQSSDDEETRQ